MVGERPRGVSCWRAADDRKRAMDVTGNHATNRALMATGLEDAGPLSQSQIVKWNKLHSVRTVLGGIIAILAFLICCLMDRQGQREMPVRTGASEGLDCALREAFGEPR